MLRIFWFELKVLVLDWWLWTIHILQPCIIAFSLLYLIDGQHIAANTKFLIDYAMLWLLGIWIQIYGMNLLWKNDFPLLAWQASNYRLSTHAFIKVLCFYLTYSLPAVCALFTMVHSHDSSSFLLLNLLMVQGIGLLFGSILGYMLKYSSTLSGLGALFLMPIYLPLNLMPASAYLQGSIELIHFVNLMLGGIACLSLVAFIMFFDFVLARYG